MPKRLLSRFPVENLIFHKTSGQIYEIEGLFGTDNTIMSEDITVPIEPGDYFERSIPNGSTEYFKVTDIGYVKGMHGIPDSCTTCATCTTFATLVMNWSKNLRIADGHQDRRNC